MLTAATGEQARRRVMKRTDGVWFGGRRQFIGDLCARFGIKRRTYEYRRSVGWTVAQALTTPLVPQARRPWRAS